VPQPAQPRLLVQWPTNDRQDAKLYLDGLLLDLSRSPVQANDKRVEVLLQLGEHTVRIGRRGFKTFDQAFTSSGVMSQTNRPFPKASITLPQVLS